MFYWIARAVVIFILRVFFFFTVEGRRNIPSKTNFIVVANHTSFLDPFAVGAALPRRIYWIALRGFYAQGSFLVRWFIKKLQTLPQGGSSERAVYLLSENKNVGLFPEGTRTYDGKLRSFRRGAALLGYKTGRPILPCAILGAHKAFPRGAKFPRLFSPIKVKIGRPIYLLKEFTEIVDGLLLQEGTIKIRRAIEKMLYE